LLSDSEQELIQAIFFDGLSEREVGAIWNKGKAESIDLSVWQ
jgi:DNA-directed RNA polymerase specialized sigma subunit